MILKNNNKIPLDKFIDKALYNKKNGYYMKKNPFGNNGDFITSPNISIMFSEMIAIWIVSFWRNLGCPKKINIIELGAGNGEMIFQIINTINKFKHFKLNSNFYIHEKSPYLVKIQKKKNKGQKIKWIRDLKKISKFPSIFLANEFFDALPIKQFLKKNNKWFEKYIYCKNKHLRFFEKETNSKFIEKIIKQKITKKQNFIEYSPLAFEKLNIISKIIKNQNGGMLIIDYGYEDEKMINSLQSIKKHKKNNLLENVYHSDITHLINFNFFKKKIKKFKLDSIMITTQREFLIKMGILERAEIISKNLPFSKKTDIYFRLKRLIDKKQMGSLFKVLFATNKKNNFSLGF